MSRASLFGSPFNPALLVLISAWLACCSKPVEGQDNQSDQGESALVDGLLDLIGETEDESPKVSEARPDLKPEDVGLDRRNLGDPSHNPLEDVRQSMLIAAGYLGKGYANSQTQQLQIDIVQRLDELIDELEKSASSDSSNSQQQEHQANPGEQQSQQRSQSEGAQRQDAKEESGEAPQRPKNSSDSTQDAPGQKGEAENVTVELLDPQALQRSVWGQLPEQVRKQMQSRMVESFLPSYREQIEAYFKALLENP